MRSVSGADIEDTSYMNTTTEMSQLSRRAMLRGATVGAAGLAALGMLMPGNAMAQSASAIPASIPGTGDIQVLNYALALEDLEADLYAQALLRLTTGGTDPQASSSVGAIAGLGIATTELDVTYIQKFSSVEAAHRDFLKGALGTSAITTVAPAKYDFGLQNMTRQQVLDLVLEAEATGVQAYLGAIPSLTVKSPYLATAAAIQGTEARHTSVLTVVRNLLIAQGTFSDPIAPVAPLKGDPGNTPTATSYSNSTPNTGTPEGRDLFLAPTEVLARVGGFIKTS